MAGQWQISIDDLTVDDYELLAERFGLKTVKEVETWFADIEKNGDMPVDAIRFFVWLMKKQSEPELTIEAVGKIGMRQLEEMMANPNAGGGQRAASSGSTSRRSSSSTKAESRRSRSGV